MLWSSTGTETILQSNGESSEAVALNNIGSSVGFVSTSTGNEATLWSSKGTAKDLNLILGPAWSNTEAVGINNAGDIVGSGDYQGTMLAFLLMHVGGATSNHYDLVDHSHLDSSSLAAPHKS